MAGNFYQTGNKELFARFPNSVFIESGTYYGDGVQAALDAGFKTIYSIELDKKLYEHCVDRFKDNPDVYIIFGDSHLVLDDLLSKINTSITFWLDGHWAGDGTAIGKYESPLIQELEAIGRHHIKEHTILIDDLRCWNKDVQGFDKDALSQACLQINPTYEIILDKGYIENDILIAKPKKKIYFNSKTMKKIYCAYGDEAFHEKLLITEETALSVGKVDKFYAFRRNDLNVDNFLENNKEILSQQPGGGLWAWKPFVILQTMNKVDDGDIVLHTSTGMKVLDNLDPLFEITRRSRYQRMFFSPSMIYGTHRHSQYTKRDCFIVMGLDEPKYWESRMLHAAYCLFMKTKENIDFLKEFLKYTTDKRAIWDTIPAMPPPSGVSNLPDFMEHRFDQAILSLLSVKYGRELYREPSQFGNDEIDKFPNSPYGQLFYQYD